MILLEDVLKLHEASIEDFGREDLYPAAIEKAAALCESLIINYPFIDGNKRTGMLGMATLLLEYNIALTANENDLYNFTISISTGEIKFGQIVEWLKLNTNPL
jgi:death on curing protein